MKLEKLNEVLKLLKDKKWHNFNEIAEKTGLPPDVLERILFICC
jgi:DNA-binding IscR family transcriptional regulator